MSFAAVCNTTALSGGGKIQVLDRINKYVGLSSPICECLLGTYSFYPLVGMISGHTLFFSDYRLKNTVWVTYFACTIRPWPHICIRYTSFPWKEMSFATYEIFRELWETFLVGNHWLGERLVQHNGFSSVCLVQDIYTHWKNQRNIASHRHLLYGPGSSDCLDIMIDKTVYVNFVSQIGDMRDRNENVAYLSNSVSLVESRKPLANGLLSIFSLVIYKKR